METNMETNPKHCNLDENMDISANKITNIPIHENFNQFITKIYL